MDNYLDELNEQQRAAVEYCDGPQLVIAGAGSGKTRVLTYKIVHLLNLGIPPYRIMALTFTNKAAREMRERIEALVGHETAARLWMGTFHSIFSRILRMNAERIGFKHDFTIYDSNDSRSLVKLIIKDMGLDDKVYKPSTVQSAISNVKNALISPYDYERHKGLRDADENAGRPLIYAIYKTYWNRCKVAGAMDFDDLLFYTNILLRDNPDVLENYQEMFQYYLVDEYQDTNFAQHLILVQLCKKHGRLCVVGDDAQSIYSFRGANIENILKLQKVYPTLQTYKLEQNYRSTQTIISAANSLIEKNKGQIAKHLFSENPVGGRIGVIQCYSDYEEAYVVANQIAATKARHGDKYSDIAVLYRTNAQSRTLEEALSNGGRRDKHGNVRSAIPYRIYGGLSFYQRKEIKDAVSYFRLSINPDDDEALRRIINYPSRGIGDTTMAKVQHCAMEHSVSMWQVINDPAKYDLGVNNGTIKKLNAFIELIQGFIRLNNEGNDAYNVARTIIERTKLLAILMNDNTPENISRQENITELLNGVNEFVDERREEGIEEIQLTHYLAQVSLLTDQDEEKNDGDCVTLMTVHAAKGLEFKHVIVVGVEEDLFPSYMSQNSLREIEEERRLLYVAITRAKKTCILTFASSRFQNGQTKTCTMSRFIRDINPDYLDLGSTRTSIQGSVSPRSNTRPTSGTATSWSITPSTSYPGIGETKKPFMHPTVSRPAPRTSAPTATHGKTPTGGYSVHSVDSVAQGMRINHSRFGAGTIVNIDKSGADAKIVVNFDDVDTKTLLLKYAKFEIIQ
ncbi:MAG: UvrD-helicase domain-containing protein [Muribaculaceae bacterium]|nr:UvrD-helicase domain-containing protein [Muribaculaceae bacterium]